MPATVRKLNLEIDNVDRPGEREPIVHDLPSGRRVVLRFDEGQEDLEVRSAQGDLEVTITLTEAGPVVKLKGARLELESPEDVSLHCRNLEVKTSETLKLHSEGDAELAGRETAVLAAGDLQLQGNRLFLN